jgi:hypothetical protein
VLQRVSSVLALLLCFIAYKFGTMSGVMYKKKKKKKKKRKKVDAENRQFQHNWAENYYFILNKGLPVSLLCNKSVSVNKEYNLKRPFTSRHAVHQKIDGQLRKDEIQKLKANLDIQQQMFNKQRSQHHSIVKASFVVSEKIFINVIWWKKNIQIYAHFQEKSYVFSAAHICVNSFFQDEIQ